MATSYPAGQMHRIAYTKLTARQIDAKRVAAADGPASATSPSDALAGQSLRIVTDGGPELRYRFASDRRLAVAENDGAAADAGYGSASSRASRRSTCSTSIASGRSASVSASTSATSEPKHDPSSGISTPYIANETAAKTCWFGVIEMDGLTPPRYRRPMHDCGVSFHCGSDGLRLSAIGAHARHAGRFDVGRFYDLKA